MLQLFKLTSEEKEQGYKYLKCIKCKEKTKHMPHGFENHNRRYSCSKCNFEGYRDLNYEK